jgi:hypothetical protein
VQAVRIAGDRHKIDTDIQRQVPDEISQKNASSFENTDQVKVLPLIVERNLFTQVSNALLKLTLVDQHFELGTRIGE